MGFTLALLLALALPLPLLAAEEPSEAPPAPPAVTITDDGMSWWEHEPDKRRQGGRTFRIAGLERNYAIKLAVLQSKQEDGTWRTDTADLGMPQPIEGNWYHSGFFRINLNGKLMHTGDPEVEVVETGRQGLLDFTWDHELARVRVRFLLRPGSDHLRMEVRWEPKPELQTITIGFGCYPEGFKVSEPDRLAGKALERHMITAERDVPQVQKVDLDLATEWWQYYQDNTLEKSPTYGPGGCALLFVPEDLESASVSVGDYNVGTSVTPKLAGGRARFALWDFNGTPNTRALEGLREQTAPVRASLTGDPWLPSTITGFSPAEETARLAELGRALGSAGAGKVAALRERVTTINRQRGQFLDDRSLAAEAQLQRAVSAYRLAYWQAERPTVARVRTLLLAGPWAYAWRLEEAARRQWGSEAVQQGGYIWKYWAGHFVTYFPANLEELLGYDVVVLADIPQDPLTQDKRQMLADYVKNGGGLLVLGGTYTGGSGLWAESPLEPLLPVQMGGAFDLAPSGQAVAVTAAGTKRLGKLSGDLGIALWRNDLQPRPGAEVWMTAGREPFAVYAPAGAGRVVYVLGTVYGEAPEGRKVFWEAPGWPETMVKLLGWLARGK